MEDSIKCKEVPRCLFQYVADDLGVIEDWSIENFIRLGARKSPVA
jgi:hypothetical protein